MTHKRVFQLPGNEITDMEAGTILVLLNTVIGGILNQPEGDQCHEDVGVGIVIRSIRERVRRLAVNEGIEYD